MGVDGDGEADLSDGKGKCEGQRPKDERREVQRGELGLTLVGFVGIMRLWLG